MIPWNFLLYHIPFLARDTQPDIFSSFFAVKTLSLLTFWKCSEPPPPDFSMFYLSDDRGFPFFLAIFGGPPIRDF